MTEREACRRGLIKLSGEAFCAPDGFGIDGAELSVVAREIDSACRTGAQIAAVVGGGNIIRGARLAAAGLVQQATADYMGMLGTVINGLALKEALDELGRPARCMTALEIPSVAEPFIRGRAIRHMEKGRVVILAAGTGNPFFTTDTGASLRATELECEIIFKATKVDGVYSADPKSHPDATRYEELTFDEAIAKKLEVMDMTALTMCERHGLPVVVLDYKTPNAIRDAIEGKNIGTLIRPTSSTGAPARS